MASPNTVHQRGCMALDETGRNCEPQVTSVSKLGTKKRVGAIRTSNSDAIKFFKKSAISGTKFASYLGIDMQGNILTRHATLGSFEKTTRARCSRKGSLRDRPSRRDSIGRSKFRLSSHSPRMNYKYDTTIESDAHRRVAGDLPQTFVFTSYQ